MKHLIISVFSICVMMLFGLDSMAQSNVGGNVETKDQKEKVIYNPNKTLTKAQVIVKITNKERVLNVVANRKLTPEEKQTKRIVDAPKMVREIRTIKPNPKRLVK